MTELGRETPAEVLAEPPLSDERIALADVTLRPLVPHPGKVVCVGLNYRAHVEEGVYEVPDYPALFSKFTETLVSAGQAGAAAAGVRGGRLRGRARVRRRARGSPRERDAALAAVGGYMMRTTSGMRDYQYKTPVAAGQELGGLDAARPILVTPDEVGDRTRSTSGSSSTASGCRLEHLAVHLRHPDARRNDLGVHPTCARRRGAHRDAQRGGTGATKVLLRDGDRMVIEIERVGRLESPVAAEVP